MTKMTKWNKSRKLKVPAVLLADGTVGCFEVQLVCETGLFNETLSLEWLLVLELQDTSAVSTLRPLTAGASLRRPGCENQPIYVGFVAEFVAAGQVYLRVFLFPNFPVIPPDLRTHTLATEGVTQQLP